MKLDEKVAYNRGFPIRKSDGLEKIQTIPMDAEWIENIKKLHWYHENNNSDIYQQGEDMLKLKGLLLSFGGQEVCLPMFEEDLKDILERGQLWFGDCVDMMLGEPSRCHSNSSSCWYYNKDKAVLCTGYALSEDGIWRQHSWCIHTKRNTNRVIETTKHRVAYFGFAMTENEANNFYFDNN